MLITTWHSSDRLIGVSDRKIKTHPKLKTLDYNNPFQLTGLTLDEAKMVFETLLLTKGESHMPVGLRVHPDSKDSKAQALRWLNGFESTRTQNLVANQECSEIVDWSGNNFALGGYYSSKIPSCTYRPLLLRLHGGSFYFFRHLEKV